MYSNFDYIKIDPQYYFFSKYVNKNENFLKIKIKLVFVWPIRGVNQKNNFTGGKTGNDLYYRGVKTY